jgi:bacterioferritin-associated ferredoxin
MLVCSCRGVSERAVTEAIAAGAHTVEHLARGCSAGARCGGCRPTLERLLSLFADATPAPQPV